MKKIPIGISEFREVIGENYYYVDKTKYIAEILESGTKVTLFTRPRRFGKTLNMTMLREFFDVQKDSKELFQGLAIANSEYYSEINSYPVLYFSFRNGKGAKEIVVEDIKSQLLGEYKRYYFIRETLNQFDQRDFDRMIDVLTSGQTEDFNSVVKAIYLLIQILREYYNKSVILLIDEYDTPMIEAYVNGYYEELQGAFSTLYGSALKDNPNLAKAVLTGIQRVAKENIFSGLNNLEVNTVSTKAYSQFFGLTSEETSTMLQEYELELTREVKQMYDGYRFGNEEIYNPWSILNYVKSKELRPYWINTSSNQLILDLILQKKNDREFAEEFETLIEEKEVEVMVNTDTTFWEMDNPQTLWGLLLNAGYITAECGDFYGIEKVRIPNEEVKTEFQRIVTNYGNFADSSLARMFYYLVVQQDLEKFKKIYQNIVLRNTSYYDAKENGYHMLFLGMCIYLDSYYDIRSNIEAGHGRSDISLTSHNPEKYPNLIIEFKQGEDAKKEVQVAMEQIKTKQYMVHMKGPTLLMGVAHNKKECEILMEEIDANRILNS